MPKIDNNRDNIQLPGAVSDEIWAKALENSAILSLARRIDLPGTGVTVPIVTGDPIAQWVGETGKAPISNSTFDTKVITPYKMSVIEPVSKEFARDYNRLFNVMVDRLPKSIAANLDECVFGWAGAPGSGFDTLQNVEQYDIAADPYMGFVTANGAISEADYRSDRIVLSPAGETILYANRDDVNRPLFVPTVHDGEIGRVLGRPVSVFQHVGIDADEEHDKTVGFMADWSRAIVGVVQNITLDINNTSTLDDGKGGLIHLWQQDMVAVKATFECGFAIEDEDAFARLIVDSNPQ